mgnify:CR=1 FL=1
MRTLPDIENLLEPLERAIFGLLIPSLTEYTCSRVGRDLMALPVRLGGDFKKNLKIGLNSVGKMYVVCAILRNALTCLY